jgi:hypothetical protein
MTKSENDYQNKESDNGHPNNDEDSAHISVGVNPQDEILVSDASTILIVSRDEKS